DIVLDEVRPAHAALGEIGVAARAARRDQDWRHLLFVEGERMIEPGPEDGRRASAILRRAEDQDGVGRPGFIACRLAADLHRKIDDIAEERQDHSQKRFSEKASHLRYSDSGTLYSNVDQSGQSVAQRCAAG